MTRKPKCPTKAPALPPPPPLLADPPDPAAVALREAISPVLRGIADGGPIGLTLAERLGLVVAAGQYDGSKR